MTKELSIVLEDLALKLCSDKALIFGSTLVVSDIHFGKVNHFRKAGIAIPSRAIEANFSVLRTLILRYNPAEVVFLGDFFHSDLNAEWSLVSSFLKEAQFNCRWILVEGNHDILAQDLYKEVGLRLIKSMTLRNLILTHEPIEKVPKGFINVHGHIHPGVRLKGIAKQGVSVSCFHLSKNRLCLPAFGELTGLAIRKILKQDKVWAVTEDGIFELNKS